MAEYINKADAIRAIIIRKKPENSPAQNRMLNLIQKAIIRIPAADVAPVVRCRECKHYREHRTKKYGNLMCSCTRMGKHDMDYPVKPDDFCSYGERRTTDAE